jgi:hypothetical protein
VRVEGLQDPGEDSVGLWQDVVVPESEHPVSTLAREFRPPAVRISLRGVLPPVELDYEETTGTAEISDERSNGMLPAELRTGKLSIAEEAPQLALGVGLIATETACSLAGDWRDASHGETPSP